jgi:hypothetical protein
MDVSAGDDQSPFAIVGAGTQPPPHRPLLRELERAWKSGDLRESELGPLVHRTLELETQLEVAKPFDPQWIIVGIRVADHYFRLIRPSAGMRDWQRDYAKTATPTLVGVARSLECSTDAQAVIVQLCEVVARSLRLTLVWPNDPDELNDVRNNLYRACLDSHEVESDSVLVILQGLTVTGPS